MHRDQYTGFHAGQRHVIQVESDLPPIEKVATLLHEAFHAIADLAALQSDQEEYLVEVFSNGLTTLMKDNPDEFKWILHTLNEEGRI